MRLTLALPLVLVLVLVPCLRVRIRLVKTRSFSFKEIVYSSIYECEKMASSKLDRIGTIYTRVTALLRTGAMKEENTPIWYDVYKAFPPTLEPRYSRRPPPKEIQRILYEEDEIRAKLHKEIALPAVNLKSNKGGLTKEKAYDQALDSYKIIFNQEKYVLTKEPRKEDQLTNSN